MRVDPDCIVECLYILEHQLPGPFDVVDHEAREPLSFDQ